MSQISFRLDAGKLIARVRRARAALPQIIATGIKKLAEDAVEKRYGSLEEGGRSDDGSRYHRLSRLDAIFIPVPLQHKRRERWPDLQPIYQAMVARHQRSYMGQSRFWVDQNKLDDLRRRVLSRLLRQGLARGTWKIRLRTNGEGYVAVTIEKQGRVTRSDQKAAAELTALMKAMFAERASAMIYQALNQ